MSLCLAFHLIWYISSNYHFFLPSY